MEKTFEKDGIVFYEEPVRIDMTEWLENHLDNNVLASDVDWDNNLFTVIAYGRNECRRRLITLSHEFDNAEVFQGMPSEVVNCIG